MKKYITVTAYPVNVKRVRLEISGADKMPLDFTFAGEVQLYARYGTAKPLGTFYIICKATTPPRPGRRTSSKTRLYAVIAGREIPLGRLAQAKA